MKSFYPYSFTRIHAHIQVHTQMHTLPPSVHSTPVEYFVRAESSGNAGVVRYKEKDTKVQ